MEQHTSKRSEDREEPSQSLAKRHSRHSDGPKRHSELCRKWRLKEATRKEGKTAARDYVEHLLEGRTEPDKGRTGKLEQIERYCAKQVGSKHLRGQNARFNQSARWYQP